MTTQLRVPLDPAIPLIPVRMLNEYVYCPRLGYLMWVQGEFEHNAYTVEGVIRHRRVDKPKGKLSEQPGEETAPLHAQSVSRPAPALDMMEPFRPLLADSAVIIAVLVLNHWSSGANSPPDRGTRPQ